MVEVALLGLGQMGRHHLRVLSQLPEVRLVAVCDPDAGRRAAVSSLTHVPIVASVAEVLERHAPELAILAIPTSLHRVVAEPFLEAGVRVIVEKPLAGTIADGVALVQLATRLGIPLGVAHIERFNPVVAAMRTALADGAIGQLFSLRTRRLGPFPPRIGDVGVVVDLCTHDLDVATHLHRSPVATIHGEVQRTGVGAHEHLAAGVLRFDDGVIATFEANWLTPMKVRELAATGERGMLLANYLTQELVLVRRGEARLDTASGKSDQGFQGQTTEIPVVRMEPLRAELSAFIASVRNDQPFPVTGEEGLRVLRLAHAVLQSAERGTVIAYPTQCEDP